VLRALTGGKPKPKAIEYAYELKGERLRLFDSDNFPIDLQKIPVVQNPLAGAEVEFVAATGIIDAGDLLVTDVHEIRAGRAGETYFEPRKRSRKSKQATALLVQDAGCQKITIDEARKLIREAMPVVVTYRHDERPAPDQMHPLWTEGPASPDSDAIWRTFSRTLRLGTVVFILSARENMVRP